MGMFKTAAFFMVVAVASGCAGNGEAPIVDDGGGQQADLAQSHAHDSGTVADMTETGPADMVLNPAPMVPTGIPKVPCSGFDGRSAVWGPAANGSFVRYTSVNGRAIARYEDSWNGNVDANCYDVTPITGSVGGFSQGRYPYVFVIIFVDGVVYITRDGWTFTRN